MDYSVVSAKNNIHCFKSTMSDRFRDTYCKAPVLKKTIQDGDRGAVSIANIYNTHNKYKKMRILALGAL